MKPVRLLKSILTILSSIIPTLALSDNPPQLTYSDQCFVYERAVESYSINDTHASVTFTATNEHAKPDNNPVYIKAIQFTIPIGTAAKDLVTSAESIQTTSPENWSLVLSEGGVFIAQPKTLVDRKVGAKALEFTFSGMTINSQEGSALISIQEETDDGSVGETKKSIKKSPNGSPHIHLNVDPQTVKLGESTTVSWSGTTGGVCTLEYEGKTIQNLKMTGSYVAKDLEINPTTFTLTATYNGGGADPITIQKQKSVTVSDAEAHFYSIPRQTFSGSEILLKWNTVDAVSGCINDSKGTCLYEIPNSALKSGTTKLNVPEDVTSVSYSLVTTNSDGETDQKDFTIRIFNVRQERLTNFGDTYNFNFRYHPQTNIMAWSSPDQKNILACLYNKLKFISGISKIDLDKKNPNLIFNLHSNRPLAIDSTGKLAICLSLFGYHFLDIESQKLSNRIPIKTLGGFITWISKNPTDSNIAYVCDSFPPLYEKSIYRYASMFSVINIKENKVVKQISIQGIASKVCISEDGKHAFVSTYGRYSDSPPGAIHIIDLENEVNSKSIPFKRPITDFVLSKDEKSAYVTTVSNSSSTGQLYFIDLKNDKISYLHDFHTTPFLINFTSDGLLCLFTGYPFFEGDNPIFEIEKPSLVFLYLIDTTNNNNISKEIKLNFHGKFASIFNGAKKSEKNELFFYDILTKDIYKLSIY